MVGGWLWIRCGRWNQAMNITHDLDLWEDIRTRYAAHSPKCYKVTKPKKSGAIIEDTDSKLGELLKYIDSHGETSDASFFSTCANKVRVAAEVLCKGIIVKATSGTPNPVTLFELNRKLLPDLLPKAKPYLVDGKDGPVLESIARKTNPGSHDDVRNTRRCPESS